MQRTSTLKKGSSESNSANGVPLRYGVLLVFAALALSVCVGGFSNGQGAYGAALDRSPLGRLSSEGASSASGRCPGESPSRTRIGPKPEVEPVVLPPGARGLLLCRYWGAETGNKSGKLASVHRVRGRLAVGSIVDELNRLQPGVLGEHTCPEDSGALVIGLLEYSGRAVKLVFGLSGCREVALGVNGGARFMSPAFLHRIARLSRP
jgi:hypothetical protein